MTKRATTPRLKTLIDRRNEAREMARKANAKARDADRDILEWARKQIESALADKGIAPGKSVMRMKIRKTRHGRSYLEETECLLSYVGRVDPPTMERGALGPNACSSDMWWCANFHWRNIRKDGAPGATYGSQLVQGDTVSDVVGKITHVRDLA